MKLCGIYFKKNNILLRILGTSNYIYSVNFKENGHFNCACQYFLNEKNHICKHIFHILFKIFKIFKKWKSSNESIYLNRSSDHKIIKTDKTVLCGKLSEISLLLLRRKIRELYFKKIDRNLYERDNYYMRYKSKENPIYLKYNKKDLEQENIKCGICLVDKNLSFQCYQCKNIFHTNCINIWIKENPNCPYCRYDMNDYYNYLIITSSKYHKI
jgi:hypothetical protein